MMLLVINPGGTSTKVSVFNGEKEILKKNIIHDHEELQGFEYVMDQLEYRKDLILDLLKSEGYEIDRFEVIVGRGGLMKPIPGGVYRVNDAMIKDLRNRINGEHASNLGACLAFDIANEIGKPAYIVDPVSVDEFLDVSRITGINDIVKASWLHALNHKAVCRSVAEKMGDKYQNLNFIVAHLGSGISIVAHLKGKMIDGSGGRSDGPFSPERSGGLPTYDLINLCFSGKYTYEEMVDKVSNSGGMYSYLRTKDMKVIEEKALSGDSKYRSILDAFCYKVSKEIASYTASLEGKVDGVIITGGIAYSDHVVDYLRRKIGWIAEVFVVPGEMEMEALAKGAIRVLKKEEQELVYR
ncbi:MAG: butyrate kinase [Peptostreptococcaceae bacterium]|nr:butyrate kinase [Peptostreptococcaceae bacterium]